MKRILAAILLMLTPALALAQITISQDEQISGENRIVLFSAASMPRQEQTEQERLNEELRAMMAGAAISMRLAQPRAQELFDHAGAGGHASLYQTAHCYADERTASLAIIWEGTQPDASTACLPYSVALDLDTGLEMTMEQLFADFPGAVGAMEAVISRDYLEDMNTYIEAADLLPMPTDCFAFDQTGLTVYYDDARYRTFDGRCGYVTIYWHEIAPYIGEDSPVYALSSPAKADAAAILGAQGYFGDAPLLGVGETLGAAIDAYRLTDEPDYTANTIYYPLEDPKLRGVAVEIPKYAQTEPQDTPICAVRHTRASWNGLTTGLTTREEIVTLLGEPDLTLEYDEDDAYAMMLCPGESLVYFGQHVIIELHANESGVLEAIILRSEAPEKIL